MKSKKITFRDLAFFLIGWIVGIAWIILVWR